MLGIPFRGEKNRRKLSEFHSVSKHLSDKNLLSILFAGTGFFVKLIFFMPFSSVPSLGIDSSVNLGMPLRMSSFFRGITEAILSLFRGIFWNEIPLPTLLARAGYLGPLFTEIFTIQYTAGFFCFCLNGATPAPLQSSLTTVFASLLAFLISVILTDRTCLVPIP
jgi:hypothetical protein